MKTGIIGAGITGLTTALTFRGEGFEILVYDEPDGFNNHIGAGSLLQHNVY